MREFFTLEVGQDMESGEFYIHVYIEDEICAEYYGKEIADVFKHTIHDYWPLLFAQLFPDYLEWTESHKTEKIED